MLLVNCAYRDSYMPYFAQLREPAHYLRARRGAIHHITLSEA